VGLSLMQKKEAQGCLA